MFKTLGKGFEKIGEYWRSFFESEESRKARREINERYSRIINSTVEESLTRDWEAVCSDMQKTFQNFGIEVEEEGDSGGR